MAAPSGLDIHNAYNELNKVCSFQSYPKVINVANKILSKYPNELKAFQCKIVALIRTEKYDECLHAIKKAPELSKCVQFEKAYAEYRLNRVNDALKTLNDSNMEELRVLELKAQLHYRREEFQDAYNCLRLVIRNSQDDFGDERLTNLVAIAAAASCFKSEHIAIDVPQETYERIFNLACYSIGKENLEHAHGLLKQAEETGRLVLSEDPEITEEEITEELAPILTQQAYLLQRKGKEDLANQIYQAVVKNRTADPALLAVVANNIMCINREQNIFESRKRIKQASLDGLQHKLFSRQRTDILLNQGLFHWYTNQVEACRSRVGAVLREEPNGLSSSRATLLLVTQLLKEKQYDKAISTLQNYLSSKEVGNNAPASLDVLLVLAQLHLYKMSLDQVVSTRHIHPQQALAVAELLKELLPSSYLHTPAVVSTRIALYSLASNGNAIKHHDAQKTTSELIQQALDWYEANGNKSPVYALLLDRLASFLMQHGDPKLAAKLYEQQLENLDQASDGMAETRQALVARLIRAYAQFDRPRAENACKSFEFANVLSPAEVDALESAFLYGVKAIRRQVKTAGDHPSSEDKGKSKNKHSAASTPAVPSSDPVKSDKLKRRKKRPVRLPKNYQPGIMPDPDRWLPRRERTGYRGKRRDKRHFTTRGPQGQVSGGAELDASARTQKFTPSTPVTPTADSAKQSGSLSKQQRKVRKKGR